MKQPLLKRITNSTWVVTFTSTILGVIIGLFLSNYFNYQKKVKAKNEAFVQVKKEIENNFENLEKYTDEIGVKYREFSYMAGKLNDDMVFVLHKDSLDHFQEKVKDLFEIENRTIEYISNDSVLFDGRLAMEITSNLIVSDLQMVIWNTYKQMDYFSLTKFGCISRIEDLYILFGDFNTLNNKWRNSFVAGKYTKNKDTLREFLMDWEYLYQKEVVLLGIMKDKDQLYTECE